MKIVILWPISMRHLKMRRNVFKKTKKWQLKSLKILELKSLDQKAKMLLGSRNMNFHKTLKVMKYWNRFKNLSNTAKYLLTKTLVWTWNLTLRVYVIQIQKLLLTPAKIAIELTVSVSFFQTQIQAVIKVRRAHQDYK